MKTSIDHISSVKKKLTIEIEAEEVTKKIRSAFRDLGKKAKIPGFRPGKVPRRLLESKFGHQVYDDVTRNLVNESLFKAMEENKTYPLGMPVIENDIPKEGQSFRYSAIIEVKPEFEIKNYMDVEVEKEILSATDEDVERELEEIRKSRGTLNPVEEDRGIRKDDYAIVEYEAFEGGEPIQGVKSSNFLVCVGAHDFHADFEEALIGLKKGNKTSVQVDFEEDHRESRLAGKRVEFKVNVLEIKTLDLPDLDDDFVKDFGDEFKDLNDFRTRVKEEIVKREEKRIENELKTRLMKKIGDGVEVELPEALVNSEIDHALNNIKQNLTRSGSSLDKAGLSEVKLEEELRPSSEQKVKNMLILGEIARLNDLSVSEQEITDAFKEIADGVGQDPEVLRQYHEANNLMDSFRDKLLEEKTLNYLIDGAKISEVSADEVKAKENPKKE